MKNGFRVLVLTTLVAFLMSCVQATPIGWDAKARDYRGQNGKKLTFEVKGAGIAGSVWGTDVYTDDSSMATAAVHAGIITFEKGGVFTVEIQAGQQGYTGSTRNGVVSQDWGAYEGSFAFVK